MPVNFYDTIRDAYDALKFDYQRVLNRNIEMHEEKKELEEKLQKLREAVWPLIDGLEGRPRSQWYFLRLDHPAILDLVKAFKESEDEEEEVG